VITPIGELHLRDDVYTVGAGDTGEITSALRKTLLDIQYGRAEDTHGWLQRVL
jgi:branched-chain amino acid aminotransferase